MPIAMVVRCELASRLLLLPLLSARGSSSLLSVRNSNIRRAIASSVRTLSTPLPKTSPLSVSPALPSSSPNVPTTDLPPDATAANLGSPNTAPPRKLDVVLNELDIEEAFVKGSGPGGQKINKCRHRVQLRHIPTNIRVESQRFRDLASNRKEARKLLKLKLDDLYNGELSKRSVRIALEQKRKKRAAQKSKKKKKEGLEGAMTESSQDMGEDCGGDLQEFSATGADAERPSPDADTTRQVPDSGKG